MDPSSTYQRVALGSALVGTCAFLAVRHKRERRHVGHPSASAVAVDELRDPENREHHLQWNGQLHARALAAGAPALLPVSRDGGDALFVALGHDVVGRLSSDPRFSSNPYPDARLIALNTMPEERHAVVAKLLHRFYPAMAMRRLETEFQRAAETLAVSSIRDGVFDVMPWAKRLHMTNSLRVLLGGPATNGDATKRAGYGLHELVDAMIQFNDDMVALVAPLGGVGLPCPPLLSSSTLRLIYNLFTTLPVLLRFLWKAGFVAGLSIIRPDKTLTRSVLGSGVWHHPELLPQVPKYFSLLLDLFDATPVCSLDGSAVETPMESLKLAVRTGEISLPEALVTIVQLMVNMTSANALGNLVMRTVSEQRPVVDDDASLDAFVNEVLRLDAPLQRNPRRAIEDVDVDGVKVPRGSSLLLLIGAANMDPTVFPQPSVFSSNRPSGQHLSFGGGSHYCLGAHLVKAEMRAALRFLLRTFPSIRLDRYERVRNVDVGNYGFECLKVVVEPVGGTGTHASREKARI